MQRDHKAYLRDIQESIRKIEKYTNNLTWEKFLKDELLQDGVIRNI